MYRAYPAPPQSASAVKDSAAVPTTSSSGGNTRKVQPWPSSTSTAASTSTSTTTVPSINKSNGNFLPTVASSRPPHSFNAASTSSATVTATPGNIRLMSPSSRGQVRHPAPNVGGPPASASAPAAIAPTGPSITTRPLVVPPIFGSPPTSRPFSFDKSATIIEDKIEERKKKLEALKAKSRHSSNILARAKAVTAPPPTVATVANHNKSSSSDSKSLLDRQMVGVTAAADSSSSSSALNRPPHPPTVVPQGAKGSNVIGISNSPPRHNHVASNTKQDFDKVTATTTTTTVATPFHDVTNEETRQVKEHDEGEFGVEGEKTKPAKDQQQQQQQHPSKDVVGPPTPARPPPPPPTAMTITTETVTDINSNLEENALPDLNTNKRLTLQALRQVATSPKRNDSLSPVKKSPAKMTSDPGVDATVAHDEKKIENDNVEPVKTVQGTVPRSGSHEAYNKVSSESAPSVPLPSSPPKESSTLRLVRELRIAKQEKEQAMKRMSELEGQVMDLRFELDANVAKSQQSERRGGRTLGREDSSMMTERRNRNRRMMKSPEPRRDRTEDPLQDLNVASRAVETVEEIFESPLARFVIRKPYGGNEIQEYKFSKDGPDEKSAVLDFPVEWMESVNDYIMNATVKDEKTLEVMAKVGADSSILLVYGDSCRHGTPRVGDDGSLTGYDFTTFENVDEMEGTLGKVIFIDSEGNDGEYWLDTIYEEALKIRESYCSNVFSAALALKAAEPASKEFSSVEQQQHEQQRQPPPPMFAHMNNMSVASPPQVMSKPIMVDECVGTEDLLPVASASATAATSASVTAKKAPPNKPKKNEVQCESQSSHQGYGSTSILSFFIVSVFSIIFNILWFILMIPVRVTQITFTICIMMAIVNVLWLYLADNKIAIDMGAMIDKQYNIN